MLNFLYDVVAHKTQARTGRLLRLQKRTLHTAIMHQQQKGDWLSIDSCKKTCCTKKMALVDWVR